jgi:hypothetical protein
MCEDLVFWLMKKQGFFGPGNLADVPGKMKQGERLLSMF